MNLTDEQELECKEKAKDFYKKIIRNYKLNNILESSYK
jgi:hypothetical protein